MCLGVFSMASQEMSPRSSHFPFVHRQRGAIRASSCSTFLVAVGSDGFAYCFYERASVDESHYRPAHLTVARFNLEWLTAGKDRLEQR